MITLSNEPYLCFCEQSGHKRQAAEEGEEETAAAAGSQRHHHMNRGEKRPYTHKRCHHHLHMTVATLGDGQSSVAAI